VVCASDDNRAHRSPDRLISALQGSAGSVALVQGVEVQAGAPASSNYVPRWRVRSHGHHDRLIRPAQPFNSSGTREPHLGSSICATLVIGMIQGCRYSDTRRRTGHRRNSPRYQKTIGD
jgi:hypothetical protein